MSDDFLRALETEAQNTEQPQAQPRQDPFTDALNREAEKLALPDPFQQALELESRDFQAESAVDIARQVTAGVPFTGELATAVGRGADVVREALGADVAEPATEAGPGLVGRAVGRGTLNILSAGAGVTALGARVFGAEESFEKALEFEAAVQDFAQGSLPSERLSFDELLERGTLSDFIVFTAENLGEQVPIVASIVFSGGAGAAGGGVIGQLVTRGAINSAQATALAARFAAGGAAVGAFGGATALETGFTALEQAEAVGDIFPGIALGAGAAKGSLELIVPLALSRRLGITPQLAGRLGAGVERAIERSGLLGFALGAAGGEAATEALQETIDVAARSFVDENFDALGPEAASRIREAAAVSALGGFFFGGGAGAIGNLRGRTAPESFDRVRPPSLEEIQAGITPEGGQLELFLGEDLGIEQPGVEQIELERKANKQLELPLAGILGETVTVDPRQLDLFDSSPVAGAQQTQQGSLFESMEVALPTGRQLVLPRGQETAISDNSVLQFQRQRDVFEQQAAMGARNTRTFGIAPELGAVTRDSVSGDAFALPLEGPIDAQFVGEESNRRTAITMLSDARNELLAGRVQQAQELVQAAFELGARILPTERSGFFIRAGDLPGGTAFESDPARVSLFGRFAAGILEGNFARGLPVVPGSSPERLGVGLSEALDLNLIDPENITAVDTEGAFANALSAARAGNAERALIAARHAGVTLSGSRQEQLATLNEIDREITVQSQREKFVELFQAGRIRQTLTNVSSVFVKGKLPPGAVVLREALDTGARGESAFLTQSSIPRPDTIPEFETLTDYDAKAHKPGTTVIVGSHEDSFAYIRIKSQYDKLLKAFGLKTKIILHSARPAFAKSRSSFNLEQRDGTNGLYWPEGDPSGVHVIWVDTHGGKNIDEQMIVAMHEFGHLLATTEFARAGSDVQEMVLNAFNRSLRSAQLRGGREAIRQAFSPIRAERLSRQAEMDESFSFFLERVGLSNWYSFDEWFAEQVVRWFATSRRAMSVSDRFFQQVARKVRTAFRTFLQLIGKDRPVRQMAAAPEIQQWLDTTLARRDAGVPPLTKASRERSVRDSTAENAALLDPVMSPVGPAQSPSFAAKNAGNALLQQLSPQERKRMLADLDKYNWIVKWGWNILQLADQNQHIAGLQRYVEFLDRWYNLKMQWIARADQRVKEWNTLGKRQADALGRFIFEIAEMNYLKPGETPRHPNTTEVAQLLQQFKIDRPAFDLYLKIVQDFNDVLTQLESTLTREAVRSLQNDPVALQNELAEIQREMTALRSRPYFPFSRFGDWTIVVRSAKDGKVIFMQQFESKFARDRAAKQVKKDFPQDIMRLDKMPEEVEIFRGLPVQMLRRMEQKLNLTAQQKVWLDALIFESAPAQSFKQRFQRRRGVAGFSYDAVRSYANYFFHGANHIARIEHQGDLQEAVNQVNSEARTLGQAPDVDISKRRQIIDFMRHHLNYVMTPANDWAALRSFAFQYWLGFAPDSALINFTQVPMVAWPYLSARFGSDVKAARELRKATLDIHKIYQMKPGKVPADELRAIELGIQQGFLDESQATELAGVSEGHVLQRTLPGNAALRLLRTSAYWSAWMFQTSEKLNRRIVFRAAYRLAKQDPNNSYLNNLRAANQLQASQLLRQGWAEEEISAFLAGKDAVRRSQFEYANWSRPRFMQGKKGVAFVFFMYMQNMLWFAKHSPGRGRYLLMLLATAGLLGLPGAEDLKDFIKFAARQFGKRFDPEEEARRFIVEAGIEKPDLLLHGLSRYGFGMGAVGDALGLPIPSVDMSGRLGLGRLVPGAQALGRGGVDFERQVGQTAIDLGGAAFNIPVNVLKAMGDGHPDFFKRWERAMPRALRNLSKAMRFYKDGVEQTRTGATIAEFDIHDPQELAEIVAQGLGFLPTRLSQRWDRVIMQQEAQQYWATKRGMLMQQFDWITLVENDREGMADVRQAIKRFNNEVPVPALRITGEDLQRSIRERQRRRKMFEAGIPGQRRDAPLARDIIRLFPEAGDPAPPADPQEPEVLLEEDAVLQR